MLDNNYDTPGSEPSQLPIKASILESKNLARYCWVLLVVVLVLLDQVTKIAIKGLPNILGDALGIQYQGLAYGEIIPAITNVLQWTYIENQGMAFGITFGWAKPLLSILSLIVSACIIYYLSSKNKQIKQGLCLDSSMLSNAGPKVALDDGLERKSDFTASEPALPKIALLLVAAGALGNGIDRCFHGVLYGDAPLLYGGVVDFILVDIPDIAFIGWTHFPVFNIADACVTCGVALLMATQFWPTKVQPSNM